MLAHHDLRALQAALQRLYVHADADTFPQRLLEAVGPLIPSAIACYTELRPGTDHVRNVADHPDAGLDALLPVLGELQLQHPRILDYVANGQQAARTTSDYLSRSQWHARELHQHFYGVMGLDDQLAILMPAAAGTHLGLVFNRERRTFTEAERHLLDLLRPHVAIAFANARAVSALKAGSDAGAALAPTHGLIRLRRNGALRFATRRAIDALARHWPAEATEPGLPSAVRGWLRRAVRPGSAREVQHDSPTGMLTLRLIEDGDHEGFVLLLEETARPMPRPLDELPPRLRRVAECLLHGGNEREIAAQLQLSTHTVHEYVKQIYRRLGVRSRPQLTARLMRER